MDNNLLLFAFEYPPVSGGISRLCEEVAAGLRRRNLHTTVLTQDGIARVDSISSHSQDVRLITRRPAREWAALRWLRRHARNTPTIAGLWYPEGLLALSAGYRPLVILAHGAELLSTPSVLRRPFWAILQRKVLEKADLVIANSEYTRELVLQCAPKARVEAIPLAVDTHRFSPANREMARLKYKVEGKHVLCTVSRLQKYKGLDTVLRALAALTPAERQDFVYLIGGTGPCEMQLKSLAKDLGLEQNIRWLGFVPEDELPQVYSASDLFALCTRNAPKERSVEGFGLVFLEAQSCGVPVVGTRTGGIPAAIREGEGGWLIEQDDFQHLSNILSELTRSPAAFQKAGLQARQRVLRECTWDGYMDTLSRVLARAGLSITPRPDGVTVVVPTLNRGRYLINTLKDLIAQRYRPLEILVVDQSQQCDPALHQLVEMHSDLITYQAVPFRGLPQARNYGWQHAKYEAIVFVDDDIRCNPDLATEHVRALNRPGVGIVAGGIDERVPELAGATKPGMFNVWTATPSRGFAAQGEQTVSHAPGGNFSGWRNVLRAAGGVDERLAVGAALYEETELCLRVQSLAYSIYFNGDARITHLAASSGGCRVPDVIKYIRALAHNRAILIRRHISWVHSPTAYIWLILLVGSYARQYRTPKVISSGLLGLWEGLRAGKLSPLCSAFKGVAVL